MTDSATESESASTPLRRRGTPTAAGFVLLRDVGSAYRDGAEDEVLDIVTGARDHSTSSVEMIVRANGWAQRYHFDPARPNVLRSLELPADARVLEIGAGCGAISRYLGETCRTVDSLEPVPARAAAAAARTADLPNVTVFVGDLADVPREPCYDVVIVVGVLEYVGDGSADREPYRRFLADIAAVLVDGGSLVLAIENRLGVKYLVGAPEDHTGRFFDSVQSYPYGGHARTFQRRELEQLVSEAGLSPMTLGAFPDYKLTRAVLGEFPSGAESLAHRLPRFPSPDWTRKRPALADERRVWRNLVEAGLDREFPNSFLVVAGKGHSTAETFWPAGRAAVFFSDNRLPALTTRTIVEQAAAGLEFRRAPLFPDRARPGPVHLVPGTTPLQTGVDLPDVIADGGVAAAQPYIDQWLQLLDEVMRSGDDTAVDIVPHNLIVTPDGTLAAIDQELAVARTRDQIVRRGIYLLAKEVALLAPPARWKPYSTVGDLMVEWGAMAGLPADGSWIDEHIRDESWLQQHVRLGPLGGRDDDEWRTFIRSGMRHTVTRRLKDLPLGARVDQRYAALKKADARRRAELAAARQAADDADAARRSARAAAAKADARRVAELAAVRHSAQQAADDSAATLAAANKQIAALRAELAQARRDRPAARIRAAAARVLPEGTRRRRIVDRGRQALQGHHRA